MFLFAAFFVLSLVLGTVSYVPASPTNSTRDAIAGGLNVTDISKLSLQWYNNGSYSEHVSYQLVGKGSEGVSKGVLVHFSEHTVNNMTAPTSAPWIALISCDSNATDASMEQDIFTLARDKGAVSALLYSLHSVACIINPEYANPATFDQVFDIFSTQSLTSAHLIEYQFGQLGAPNKSIFAYDSQQLNNSADAISQSIKDGYPTAPGFLLGLLESYNATTNSNDTTGFGGGQAGTASGTSGSTNTALAMIILYVITGCVTALFCVVVISGAIRAIRHPERYGPRVHPDDAGAPQSRARGLTRAILDTFPLVKFGSAPIASENSPTEKDPENVNTVDETVAPGSRSMLQGTSGSLSMTQTNLGDISSRANEQLLHLSEGETSRLSAVSRTRTQPQPSSSDVVPAAIGRDTCPICIVDFEEGDDIRVLPCEGEHCFHQQCVDPWLLQLSSSCPICRHDFLTLEIMLSSEPQEETLNPHRISARPSRPDSGIGRFSHYINLARHRHRRHNMPQEGATPGHSRVSPPESVV